MGLDSIEIVLRIEETFAVDLPDDELGSIRTVGELYALLLSKLDGGYACLSSRAFYRVRRAMTEVLGMKRESIRPSTQLERILPRYSRTFDWKRIQKESGLRLPALMHPRWFHWAAFGICMSIYLLFCLVTAPILFEPIAPVSGLRAIAFPWAVAVGCIPFGMLLLRFATPFLNYELPMATAGELAQRVLSLNYALIGRDALKAERPNTDEVWRILQDIFVDQLQIDREKVVPEANILYDLGCE
jgi:acyl carrier protein